MEMALLRRYAPSMNLSLRMCTRLAPRLAPQQLPVWIRQSGRGGLSVSHGDCLRQDNWGVPLCFRFVASATNSVSSVSARPQYLAILCHRQQHPSSAKKNLLQNSGRALGGRRLFSSQYFDCYRERANLPKQDKLSFIGTKDKLEEAVEEHDREGMLEGLRFLKEFAENKDYYEDKFKAADLLSTAVSPLCGKHGGGLDHGVVKQSLEVARLLLNNAPEEIRIKLYNEVELKPIFKRIRDCCGSADHEVMELANQILAKLPSTPK